MSSWFISFFLFISLSSYCFGQSDSQETLDLIFMNRLRWIGEKPSEKDSLRLSKIAIGETGKVTENETLARDTMSLLNASTDYLSELIDSEDFETKMRAENTLEEIQSLRNNNNLAELVNHKININNFEYKTEKERVRFFF